MERDAAHPLPAQDPFGGGPLVITELEAVESGVTIRGRFEVPRFARLSPEQARYLETFLRCRGMLNSVERELGISYPTARARLDAVLRALGLHAVREDAPPAPPEPSTPMDPPEGEPNVAASSDPVEDEPFWEPAEEEEPESETHTAEEPAPRLSRDEILSMLERGEISVEDVKKELAKVR